MSQRPDLPAQTSLRGLAAFTVFIAHAGFYQLLPQYPLLKNIYNIFLWHNVAVDLFFELSGFILCYVYLRRDFKWRRYALARFCRIYPLFLAAVLFFLFLNFLALMKTGVLSRDADPSLIVSNLLLIQCWPLLPHFKSIDVPTWSISVEVFLYIFIFPTLCFAEKYVRPKVRIILAVVPILALTAIYTLLDYQWKDVNVAAFTPFRGILCFISGFFVCTMGLERGFPGFSRKIEAALLLVAAGSLLFEFPLSRGASVLLFPLLAYMTANTGSLTTQLLNRRALVWLGDISYSLYVWHWAMMKTLGPLMGIREVGGFAGPAHHFKIWQVAAYAAALIGTTLLISHLSHFYFERPVMKLFRKNRKH